MLVSHVLQNIVIKNSTNQDLQDIYLKYDKLPMNDIKIDKLDKNTQIVEQFDRPKTNESINLNLYYYKNNIKEKITVENKLNLDDLENIEIIIKVKNNNLVAKVYKKDIEEEIEDGKEFFVYSFVLLVFTLIVLSIISNFL